MQSAFTFKILKLKLNNHSSIIKKPQLEDDIINKKMKKHAGVDFLYLNLL